MSGRIISVAPKRSLDFSSLAVGGTVDVVLADRVDVGAKSEVTLLVNVFSHSLSGSTGTIHIMVLPQTWTQQEPGLQFLGAPSCNVMVGATVSSPAYLVAAVPMLGKNCVGGSVRVVARAVRTASGTMDATVAVSLSVRDSSDRFPPGRLSNLRLWGSADDPDAAFDTAAPNVTFASVPQRGSLSGAWAQATKADQPLADALNYRVCAVGQGSGDALIRTGVSDIKFLHDGTGCTLIAVVRPTSGGNYFGVVDSLNMHDSTHRGLLVMRTPGDMVAFSVGNGSGGLLVDAFVDGATWLPIGQTRVVWLRHSSNASPNYEFGFDASTAASGNYDTYGGGPSSGDASMDLHWGGASSSGYIGYLGELVISSDYQPMQSILAVVSWLKSKWGS